MSQLVNIENRFIREFILQKEVELQHKNKFKPVFEIDSLTPLLNAFVKLYIYKEENKIFSQFSSYRVYENSYSIRLKEHLGKFTDGKEIDFLQCEMTRLDSSYNDRTIDENSIIFYECDFLRTNYFKEYLPKINLNVYQSIIQSIKRKKQFLIDKIIEIKNNEVSENNNSAQQLEETLELSQLPKLNIKQRFYLFEKIQSLSSIQRASIKQEDKHKILALIMGISKDNAKHLLNHSKVVSEKEIEILEDFFDKIGLDKSNLN